MVITLPQNGRGSVFCRRNHGSCRWAFPSWTAQWSCSTGQILVRWQWIAIILSCGTRSSASSTTLSRKAGEHLWWITSTGLNWSVVGGNCRRRDSNVWKREKWTFCSWSMAKKSTFVDLSNISQTLRIRYKNCRF
jgi:hypothetical protein